MCDINSPKFKIEIEIGNLSQNVIYILNSFDSYAYILQNFHTSYSL